MKDKNKATPSARGGYTLTKKTVKNVGSPLAKKKEMPVSASKTLKKKPLKKK